MLKNSLIFALILFFGVTQAQVENKSKQQVTLAYEGGFLTHPGASIGYARIIPIGDRWQFRPGVKMGTYFHRRYQTALFVLPNFKLVRMGKKKGFWGLDMNIGYQWHFIANTFTESESGDFQRQSATSNHLVISPGFLFGRRIQLGNTNQLEWFVNPQLQIRQLSGNSDAFRSENYLLLAIGLNFQF